MVMRGKGREAKGRHAKPKGDMAIIDKRQSLYAKPKGDMAIIEKRQSVDVGWLGPNVPGHRIRRLQPTI